MRPSMFTGAFVPFFALACLVGAQSSASCFLTDVPGPIVLPDDSVEVAGRLEICLSSMYSPVAGFHRASVNGRVAGLFRSRKFTERVATDPDDERASFVFSRLADGKYELEAYRLSDGQERITFEMRPVSVRTRWRVRPASAGLPESVEP